jgi:hypothetical protein
MSATRGPTAENQVLDHDAIMPTPRSRRIVRRAAMAMAGVVLLVSGYVGSVASLFIANNAGWLPEAFPESVMIAYPTPLIWYARSELPGSTACLSLMQWAIETGNRLADDDGALPLGPPE